MEPLSIRLTIWQATTATVTLLVALCSLTWTIYSKCEDWKIAKADKIEKQQGKNNVSTAQKLVTHEQRIDELEKKLRKSLDDNKKLKKQWQDSIHRYEYISLLYQSLTNLLKAS